MNKQNKKPRSDEMYKAILTLKTVDECKRFFDDLCTVTELQAMEQRYQVAVYLSQGMIYNDILERTGASSATISRVNRSLQYGAGRLRHRFRAPEGRGERMSAYAALAEYYDELTGDVPYNDFADYYERLFREYSVEVGLRCSTFAAAPQPEPARWPRAAMS